MGKKKVTKIKEAKDIQIPLFTNEDKGIKYLKNQYVLFSPNSWYNIITIFLVFLISLTTKALLTLN